MRAPVKNIGNRKKEHLQIAFDDTMRYQLTKTGFDRYRFVHNALPEMNLPDVDTSTEFLGYKLQLPLMFTAMSGGERDGKRLNRDLAIVANAEKIVLGLGSIRPALENPRCIASYRICREYAPDVPIIANIGAAQLSVGIDTDKLNRVMEEIGATALSIHLNPLQEALQPEGHAAFRGVSRAIEILKETVPLPIIVKEVGFGLSGEVIKRLQKIGVEWFDVAGSGGTSWVRIEHRRIENEFDRKTAEDFFEWGNPTTDCIAEAMKLKGVHLIASGGILNGIDFSKAIALGAELGGSAATFLRAHRDKGIEGLGETIRHFKETLRLTMFCTGCKTLVDFCGNQKIIRKID